MAEQPKSKTKWLPNVVVKDETHAWIISQANKKGKRVEFAAGLLLDEIADIHIKLGIDHDGKQSGVWNWDWFLRREAVIARARYAARIHVAYPDDESLERLEKMCDEAGLLVAETIAEVSNDPFSSAVLTSRSSTLLGECTEWLSGVLTRVGDEGIESNTIYTLAKENGYSGSTLERAKRNINQDIGSPSVKSVRDGPGWRWTIDK